jgi:hypothetical protein
MPRTINWDRVNMIRGARALRVDAESLVKAAKETDDLLTAAAAFRLAAKAYQTACALLIDARADNLATKMGEAAAECQKASDALLARAAA